MTDFGFGMSPPSMRAVELVPEQQQDVELIAHMANYSDMLIIVSGPEGSGKTTLALELIRQHAQSENCLLITADVMLGMPSMLRRIADMSHLSLPTDRQQAVAILQRNGQERAAMGQKLLVLIDRAEQLDTDTLNDIAQLASVITPGVAFILLGVTGFERHLHAGHSQTSAHLHQLQPLSEASAQRLIQQVHKPNQPLPLEQTELKLIYAKSEGLPGSLLTLAADYFITPEDGLHPVASGNARAARPQGVAKANAAFKFPLTHLLALGFLALALLASYLYNPNSDEATTTPAMTVETVDVLRSISQPAEPNPFLEPAPAAPLPDNASAPSAPAEADYNYSSALVEETAPTITPTPVAAVAPAAPITQKVAEPAKNTAKLSSDAQRLNALTAGFVVQLFGSYEQENAQKFKQQWQGRVKGELYLYETRHQNKAWFVVVAGVYPNKIEAEHAVQRWPAELRKQAPWIRDIGSVQQSLR